MKQAIVLLVFLVVAMFSCSAQAQYIDLSKGGKIIDNGVCWHGDKPQPCVTVAFNGKAYNVILDKDGEVAIYELSEDKTSAVLLWSRKGWI